MKMIRFFIVGLLLVSFSLPEVANAQATSEKAELSWEIFIPCANGGLGEWATGTLTLHYVLNKNKWYHHQPMGSVLIGEDTGTVYHATGITQSMTVDAETLVTTHVDVYHFVGAGIQFMDHIVYHVTTVDGTPVVIVDHEKIICR